MDKKEYIMERVPTGLKNLDGGGCKVVSWETA